MERRSERSGRGCGNCRKASGSWAIQSHRSTGDAADALKAITVFARTFPGVKRIEPYIEPWNRGSIRAAEKAGHRHEGLLPTHQEIGGIARDMHLYVAP
ncbi:GNAT family protein [Amycolatopsis coloradensis]|uniref:GNAT family N-acetyltransferase n=1 Tax=Amycolatopsis coloradensis TaxID=76021 RepID=UPI00313449D7